MRIRIGTGAESEVVLPAEEAAALGLAGGGDGELISARGAFALLLPAREKAPAAWFSGSLAALTVPEVVHFVFTSLKTGVLLLAFGEGRGKEVPSPDRLRRKSLYFRDGQLVFASSSDRADRLGEVLRRAGLVPWVELERCQHLVQSGRPLGQVLVEEGVLTSGQLYEGIGLQVKEILLNAFVEADGTFAFLEGAVDEGNAVKQMQRTRDLLLEGLHRVEEAEALSRELGGRRAVFARGEEPARPLLPEETALVEAADGRRDLTELALETGLALLLALRAAAALVRDGVLRPAPRAQPQPKPPGPEALELSQRPTLVLTGPFDIYRRMLARVHAALAPVQPDGLGRLYSYFGRLPARNRAVFEGVRFGPDGELDVARVLDNVLAAGKFKGPAARARALEALEDLLAFALFEVKNVLPRPLADQVLREVGQMQLGEGMTAAERLCAALDFPSLAEAEAFARAVAPEVGMLKVGLELFAAEGPAAVRALSGLGRPVFLDLKLHDIPNTVLGAARSAARTGARLLSVHAAGGRAMVEAAVRGAGPGVRILAITVLTSLGEDALLEVGLSGPPREAVVRLARLAVAAGAGGLVCSPQEVQAVRAAVGPGPLLVVPGVRPAGAALGDQARVATPAEAVRAGADVLVVGRPLREGGDPAAAARRIAAELE